MGKQDKLSKFTKINDKLTFCYTHKQLRTWYYYNPINNDKFKILGIILGNKLYNSNNILYFIKKSIWPKRYP